MYSRNEATREECEIGSSSHVRRKDQKVPGGERYWAIYSPVLIKRPLIYCPDNLINCAITVLSVLFSECFVNVLSFPFLILMLYICPCITPASCFYYVSYTCVVFLLHCILSVLNDICLLVFIGRFHLCIANTICWLYCYSK